MTALFDGKSRPRLVLACVQREGLCVCVRSERQQREGDRENRVQGGECASKRECALQQQEMKHDALSRRVSGSDVRVYR